MLKKLQILILFGLVVFPTYVNATNLFQYDAPIQDGLNVREVSDVFADIYEKLDDVYWGGQDIDVSIDGLARLNPRAHIETSGTRTVLVWNDEVIGNFPHPEDKDWHSYGEVTTAFLLKMRERDKSLRALNDIELYMAVVNALLADIDQDGNYIYSRAAINDADKRILTSLGFDGGRDERGNFRITGIFKDSPADIAGMHEDDIVSEINGKSVKNMSDGDITSILSGYDSGTVKLKLLTPFGNRNVTLRRATVMLADADIIYRDKNENTNGILEIIIHKITPGAVNIVNEALNKYTDVDGIILDLRTTFGNDERAAAKLAGLFIGQKPVMRIAEDSNDELEIIPGGNAVTDLPTVVLISDTTRGTSEAIASAFYENNRGVLIGTPTSGRTRIASFIDLKNGGVLEVFNKPVKTGNGNKLDGRGVFPLVCLSNIQNTNQRDVFLLNVLNGEFTAHDYNTQQNLDINGLRRACPNVVDGSDEDAMAAGVSAKILTEKTIYNNLMDL